MYMLYVICNMYMYMYIYMYMYMYAYMHICIYIYMRTIILICYSRCFHICMHIALPFLNPQRGGASDAMVETERRRFSGEAAGEARRRSATTEGCRRGRSPRRAEPNISSRVSKTKTLLSQLERQKVPLLEYDWMGWYLMVFRWYL